MKTFREFQDDAARISPLDTYAKINKWAADQYANQMIEYRRQNLNQLLESYGLKLIVLETGEWDIEQTIKTIRVWSTLGNITGDMITEEEYERAQAIIHEYHRERQQQAELELEEDDPMNYEDEDDILERKETELFERALNCTCGAWVLSQDRSKVLHAADCICGAE